MTGIRADHTAMVGFLLISIRNDEARDGDNVGFVDIKYWAEPERGRLGMIRVVTPSDHDG